MLTKHNKASFIAEIGKASHGDLNYCKRLIEACKQSGVNAVRFHHFFPEENVYHKILDEPSKTERSWSFQLELPFMDETLFSADDYRALIAWCDELGLDFIGAPWDLKAYDFFLILV